MESTKILKSLRKLDPEIRKRFRLYLLSPYFNRSKTFIKSLDVLSAFIDKYPDRKLSKEQYWKKVFGNENFKEVNLRKLNSDLLRIFKDFLAQEQYQTDEGRQMNYLMRAVHGLDIDALQSISIRQSDKFFEETPFRNANYYLEKYTKEKEYYKLIDFDKDREAKSNVEEILRNLDLFYLSEKLYFLTSSIVRSRILSHDYKLLWIDEILEHIKKNDYDAIPSVSIYYHLALSLSDIQNVKEFERLKYLIAKNIHFFPKDEAIQIYTGAQNFTIAKLNSGNNTYYSEYLDLFDDMKNHGFLLESDGYIPLNKFRNACQSALRIKKFDWVEDFIKEFGHKLHPSIRDRAIDFTTALVHFGRKEFSKAGPLLASIEYDDVAFGLTAKMYQAFSFYELEEFDLLESNIDAMKVFLSRRKDLGEAKRGQVLLLYRYLSRLIRLVPGDKKSIDKFINTLSEKGKVINSEFLLEKANELR